METQTPEKLIINDDFLKGRPLSYSSLKHFRKSPKHYIQYLTKAFIPTDATIIGSIVDVIVLTPELLDKRFMLFNKPNLRTTAGKAEMAMIQDSAKANRITLITQDQLNTAKKCKESLLSVPMSRDLIEGMKQAQIKLQWTDKKRNLPLIGYVDFESHAWGEKFIVDLKTSRTADPDEYAREIVKWNLLTQLGSYLTGYHKMKYQFPYFIFLVVENKEPFNVSVNFVDDKLASQAKEEFDATLTAFRYCMDNDLFHQGYEFRLQSGLNYFSINIPKYYKPKFM